MSGIFGCVSVTRTKDYFQNKIIVYRSETGKGEKKFNANYIVYKNDSVIQVKYPYDLLIGSIRYDTLLVDSVIREYPVYTYAAQYAQAPYVLKKVGKKIFISYILRNKSVTRNYYSLRMDDSVKMNDAEFLCPSSPFNNGISVYHGRDTVIKFNNIRLKCWVFTEYYSRSVGLRRVIVYTEKSTLLPVIRVSQSFEDEKFKIPSGPPDIYRMNFILQDDTTKYRAVRCNY